MAIAAIASIVLKKFDDLLIEEPNLFNGVKNEVGSIKDELQLIQRYFNLSEREINMNLITGRQSEEDIPPEIRSWIEKAKELVFETEDILDTFISWKEQRRKQKYTFFIHFRNNFSNKLKRIQSKYYTNRLEYGINPPEDRVETSRFINRGPQIDSLVRDSYWDVMEAKAIGLEGDVKSLVSRLIDEEEDVQKNRRVISIVGMGGLGKTTLAKLLYNDSRVIEYFQIRCWIYVSQDYRVEEIMNRIWNSITGHRESSLTVEQSAARLCKFLDGKKYLFVMDEVWDAEAWLKIEELLPDTRNGNRVLLTTRDRDGASRVDPKSLTHEMDFLSEEDSRILLRRWVRLSGRKAFHNINSDFSREIITKCGGLPLVIKMVTGLLWMRNKDEWYNLLNRFFEFSKKTDPDFFQRMLELSYNELPSHLKPLYLNLLFFPKEHEIPLRRIFGLWLAQGFLTGKHEEVSREELARGYLNELIVRNMIEVVKWKLDGTPKTFLVPGLLRDVLLPRRARDIGLFHNQNINSDTALPGRTDMEAKIPASVPDAPATQKYVRHFVEYTDINDSLSLERFIRNSRSYISFNFRIGDSPAEVTGRFLGRVIQKHSFRLLGILDLERVYKPKPPDSLGKLHLLKYLGLRWTFLDAIPSSVGDLLNLETLDVKHTYISRLPSSIRKMKKLQHLYLNEIHLDLSVGDIALQNLQTLWGLTADGENPKENNLNCLITLTKLGLTVQDTLVEVYAEWILRLTALRILRFRSRDECGQPSDLKLGSFSSLVHLCDLYLLGKLTMENPLLELQLPESLTVLTLSVSGLEQDPMPTLEKLPNLRALRLFANSFTGKRMVCSNGGFPSLCILKLWMLVELEEWIIEEEAMISLEQLEIRCCKKLKKCPNNMLQLTMLGDLILTNMSKDFVAEVEAGNKWHVSLTLNNWEFPTFPDQETSHGG